MTELSGSMLPRFPLFQALARNWGLLLLRGIVAVLFGVIALVWPGITLLALIWVFGVYALVDGILALVAAFSGRARGVVPTWWLVIVGIVGILAGIVTLAYPGLTGLMLAAFIGVWSIIRGIAEIVGAIQVRKTIDNEWWLVLEGVICVLFGLFLLIHPGAGALAVVWGIGIYAIVIGIALIVVAFEVKHHARQATTPA